MLAWILNLDYAASGADAPPASDLRLLGLMQVGMCGPIIALGGMLLWILL